MIEPLGLKQISDLQVQRNKLPLEEPFHGYSKVHAAGLLFPFYGVLCAQGLCRLEPG